MGRRSTAKTEPTSSESTSSESTSSEPAADVLIEARELTKSFGALEAVRGVSFAVERGQVTGFVGPNGAGKTTTFRMLAGSLGATSGSVRVAGFDVATHPLEAKRRLGYMPEAPPLYPELTTEEYLSYRAQLKGHGHAARPKLVARAAERTHVGNVLGVPIGHLSKGFRQRVALADALLGEPAVLLLDEPTASLDPNQVIEVRALIRELSKDSTILLSTHVLSEVEATCERALVLHQGRLVASGTLDELRAARSGSAARFVVAGDADHLDDARRRLAEFGVVVREAATEANVTFEVALASTPGDATSSVHDLIARCLPELTACVRVLEARPASRPLDEVFAALTRDAHSDSESDGATAPQGGSVL